MYFSWIHLRRLLPLGTILQVNTASNNKAKHGTIIMVSTHVGQCTHTHTPQRLHHRLTPQRRRAHEASAAAGTTEAAAYFHIDLVWPVSLSAVNKGIFYSSISRLTGL